MDLHSILVVGGAGFIGSHMVKRLRASGFRVSVLDNLSTGHRDALPRDVELIEGDLGDSALLERVFAARRFDAVMHFAAHIEVGESVVNPARYYQNNVAATLRLLDAMLAHEVSCFVFSSTAAVYGMPQGERLREDDPCAPINPYGHSKRFIEQILADYDRAYRLRSVCLRYFNAAGADPEGRLGERHEPETHLIPLILQAAAGRRADIKLFGEDYDTPDGSCIRDFVHVEDLCDAHERALRRLLAGGASDCFNLGSGHGYSVREVIDAARRVTGCHIPVTRAARRAGDPPRLVADIGRARDVLAWSPAYALDDMIAHAWRFECQRYDTGRWMAAAG